MTARPAQLMQGPLDFDHVRSQINVSPAKRGQLAPAQAAECREQYQRPVPSADSFG